MNRIEERLKENKVKKKKSFITYITAGLPDMEGMKGLIHTQELAGVDVIELGVPFSDPVADGEVIQKASQKSIEQGTNIKGIFQAVKQLRQEGSQVPLVFMMYYNTILTYGITEFVKSCKTTGVDGLIVPDLPMEEQQELQEALEQEEGPILIQLVSPVSKDRIKFIVKKGKGFIYCVSSMGVTGGGSFYNKVKDYLMEVRKSTDLPIMMGFGIKEPKDVEPYMDVIDGAIVGSHFIRLMEESSYNRNKAKEYIENFKAQL
ncbi:MAG: tryptophan synthase subunit alpha [Lachnospiraceae bacterium]|nr:tryptophan synthase subunit alpha [Lachnospiraceae bacterium]